MVSVEVWIFIWGFVASLSKCLFPPVLMCSLWYYSCPLGGFIAYGVTHRVLNPALGLYCVLMSQRSPVPLPG